MKAEVRVKLGKDLGDGTREVTIVGKPKLSMSVPKLLGDRKDKEFTAIVELSKSGTLKITELLDVDKEEVNRRKKEIAAQEKADKEANRLPV